MARAYSDDLRRKFLQAHEDGERTLEGLQAPLTMESPTDGDGFLACLEQVWCPRLSPGQVVIRDNLAAHKVAGVRQRIEATGATLLTQLQPD